MPIVVSETHFQNTMSSLLTCDLTFCLVSMLKIWSVRAAIKHRQRQIHAYFMLQLIQLTLQSQYFLFWMHYGRVGCNRSSQDIVGVGEVDYDYLILLVDFFSNANKMVGFKG
jgi:hypothetical protein